MNCPYVTTVKRGIFTLLLLMLSGLTVVLAQEGNRSETTRQLPARGLVVDEFGNAVNGVALMDGSDTVAVSYSDGYFDLVRSDLESLSFAHPSFYAKEIDLNKGKFVSFQGSDSV